MLPFSSDNTCYLCEWLKKASNLLTKVGAGVPPPSIACYIVPHMSCCSLEVIITVHPIALITHKELRSECTGAGECSLSSESESRSCPGEHGASSMPFVIAVFLTFIFYMFS